MAEGARMTEVLRPARLPLRADPERRRRQRGLTLLELLIVIFILSLIVVTLTGGVRFAGRAWAAQERLIDRQDDVSAAQTVMRQLIASGHAFQGDDGSLRFVGQLPRALKRGGLFDIELLVEDDRLIMTWRPHFTGPGPKPDPEQADLVKDVTGFTLAYFFAKENEAATWQAATPADASAPPALIMARLERAAGKAWPPLVVRPMIDEAPGQKK
jgi:prepilin-type N-terminal cleavage/methylation domain-containing protein